jgi:hypothetical protein
MARSPTKLDLDTLQRLSKVARDDYGLSGAGSTAHDAAGYRVSQLPEARDGEIHLKTNFRTCCSTICRIAARRVYCGSTQRQG